MRKLHSLHVRNLPQVGVLHRQLSKQACIPPESEIEAQRALQRQLKACLFLNAVGDALAVVVRVKKQHRPNQNPDQEEREACN